VTGRSPAATAHPEAGLARRVVLGGLAVLILAAGATWWLVLRDDAPPPAALGDCAPPPDGESTSTPEGTWLVDAGDPEAVFVGYRIEERFGGETVTKTAVGRSGSVEGQVVVEQQAVTDVSVVAQLDELRSDRTARDTALHTKGLETDLFPEARFTLTEPIPLRSLPDRGATIDASATGVLELHGRERAIELPIEACWTGPTIRLSGSAPIVLADYGMEQIETPIVEIADHGELEFELVLTPA
jgi:polyisoprenoid-binding protein YceI